MSAGAGEPHIESVTAEAYTIPTEAPESDGTFDWSTTTLVLSRVRAGGREGIGYTYASTAAATVIRDDLASVLEGLDALAPEQAWERLRHRLRNVGRPGIASCALSAVDTALWDLKAKLLDVPVLTLLGPLREEIPAYGSGGFTSSTLDELREQTASFVEEGMWMVKMKIGRAPGDDLGRVDAVREAVGHDVEIFVDANGAFDRKEALGWAGLYADYGVTWFEEPVPSSDREGLRLLRDQGPGGMQIAAGEYVWDVYDARDLLEAGAVDTLQVDATRCGGYTPFLRIAALAEACHVPVSAHGAPTLHLPVMCAIPGAVHMEHFHDHRRIESLLLDGWAAADDGMLRTDPERPGLGFDFKDSDAGRFRVEHA